MVHREPGEHRKKCGVLKWNTMDTVRVAISKNSVSIRLTYKQWAHIVDSHDYNNSIYDIKKPFFGKESFSKETNFL